MEQSYLDYDLNLWFSVFLGCYGTLGLESGVISDSQISVSSVWEWGRHGDKAPAWASTGARLKKPGLPWAAANSDTKQWIQVDLKKEKRVTGERENERQTKHHN